MVAVIDPKLQRYLDKREEIFSRYVNNITFLEGKKGKGKSLSCVAIAYNLKVLFKIPTVVIGTPMGLNKNFGDFTYIDEKEFVGQLSKITTISKDTDSTSLGQHIEELLQKMGINIFNSLLIFDEAYKLFDARTPMDKLVKIFGYFVAQSRHYGTSCIIISPRRDMVDKRIRTQVDIWAQCSSPCRAFKGQCVRPNCSHISKAFCVAPGYTSWDLKVFGPNYWPMYNSWNIPGYRQAALNVKVF